VKVVGQVSAGALRNASVPAAVSYSSAMSVVAGSQAFSHSISHEPAKPYQVAATQTTEPDTSFKSVKKISVEEAYGQWQQWVGEVRKMKIGIGTLLGESRIVDVADGALRIGCPDDFHLSSLKRHKEFLGNSLHQITGLALRIEPVLFAQPTGYHLITPSPTTGDLSAQNSSFQSSSQRGGGNGEEHPLVLALKRELGAERVQ
jgi:hypothetical protein